MFQRASSIVGLLVLMGCQHPAAPTVVVEAQRAGSTSGPTSRATHTAPPTSCPNAGPVRMCRTHPDCLPPWGTTPKQQDCHRFEWVDYGDAMLTSKDEPCELLRMAALLDAHLEVNDHYKRTLPDIVTAELEYRRTSVELSTAAKVLAKALRVGGASTVEMARARFLTAIPAHELSARRALSACAPEPAPF